MTGAKSNLKYKFSYARVLMLWVKKTEVSLEFQKYVQKVKKIKLSTSIAVCQFLVPYSDTNLTFLSAGSTYPPFCKGLPHASQISNWDPALGNEALFGDIQVEHVQRVVDGLHFTHHDHAVLKLLGDANQHTMTMILCLI